MGGIALSSHAARRSRIAIAVLVAAFVAAAQAPATAALAGPSAARSPRTPAAAKPSPKPSTKPSTKPSAKPSAKPPAKAPAKSATPSVPTPVATEPQPTQDCPGPGDPSPRVNTIPWAQTELDWSSAWALTEGQGVTVAVVDSGVDYNLQLAGKVTAIDATGTGFGDCIGHGTEIAGIIAASDMQAQGFAFEGVAPQAKILSVKVNAQDEGTSTLLAEGIRVAAEEGAKVINVSIITRDTPALRSAVDFALRRNAVIVAAGGNDEQDTGVGPFYPASYPGVLSVGAVADDGSLPTFSDQRSHVAVTAPGVNVTSTCPGGYEVGNLQGTSYATAYVSGLAALVRSRYPKLSQAAVVHRIEETANGGTGAGTGDGLINPLLALTAILPSSAAASPSPSSRPQPVSVSRAPPPDRAAVDISTLVTVSAVGVVTLVAIGALVVRLGRRRRWRAGRAKIPAAEGKIADDPSPAG